MVTSMGRTYLATLTAGRVIESVAHVLVDSQRFTCDSRLVAGDERITLVLVIFVAIVVFVVAFLMFLDWFTLSTHCIALP